MTRWMLAALTLSVAFGALGCGKKVDPDKTLKCAANQPYKAEADCKQCCGGDFKLSEDVCICYK